MAQAATADWGPSLAAWLAPFLEALGHKTRQRWAPVYVRGLLGPGERKSVQPMAARVAPADGDQLHHFISRPAIRRRAGQDGELPGPGLAHPGPRRSAGARGAAALSAQGLVPGSETLRQGGGARGMPRLPQQGGDRARRAR